MPVNNLSTSQVDAATADSLVAQLQSVLDTLNPLGRNLTPEERQQYGSINERNKLVTGKAQEFHLRQPGLQSPDVDWDVFDASWQTRSSLAAIEDICKSIIEVASDTRIIHDYDLYQMTLTDYDYTKYKAGSTTAGGGYTTKYEELKQFLNTGGGNPGKAEQPAVPAQ